MLPCLSVGNKGKRGFSETRSESDEGKSQGSLPGEVPQGLRDFLPAGQTKKSDREIPEKGHEDRRRSLSRGALVFPENDVPDPVKGLDSPMTANEGKESFWRGFFGRKTGDAIDHFCAGMAAVEVGGVAFEAKDLLMAGEGEVWKVFQPGTDGEDATFDPAVTFIEGRKCLTRGEKPPRGGFR